MKSKLFKEHQKEQEKELEETKTYQEEEEDESSEVEAGHTGVAGATKSKLVVIVASAFLITLVIYFIFFKGADQSAPVDDPTIIDSNATLVNPNAPVTPISPEDFIENPIETFETREQDFLTQPELPEIPSLPEISDDLSDNILPSFLDPAPETQNASPTNLLINNGAATGVQPINSAPIPESPRDPRRSPIIVESSGSGSEANIFENDHFSGGIVSLNEDPINSLQETADVITATVVKDRSTTIIQGKMMNAILETAINTEIPGSVRGIISRNVYSEAGNNILIPRGSRLYGSYSSQVVRGQGRVEINWTRIIRPDGVDLSIDFVAADQFGRAGIEGDIDNRYGSVLANSLLTSVLAIGGALIAESLSGDGSVTTTTNPETGTSTSTGSASSQVVSDVSSTIVDAAGQLATNKLDTRPVIRVSQGTRITVIVNNDMSIPKLRNR
ncbi:MAG: type IV secretion system protein VirB10 [Lentimonas sp.]|jgi:type IV secretion system protein VirB10